MARQNSAACGLGTALAVISGKWKATILWEVHSRPVRFGELRRRIPGISEKILFEQLRAMEADGLIRRDVFDEVPSRVEYAVTQSGASLNAAVHTLAEWGLDHASDVGGAAAGTR
ncbi:winged helix-turn-helix transcriptional regulator [Streptomyces sp. 8N114]|uniref:winged helix-turn-helix transcriptional regulator n=1 Tax=Streptomyces sp. 8N114 TaxID=3457419 RepID=UPI003FD52D47